MRRVKAAISAVPACTARCSQDLGQRMAKDIQWWHQGPASGDSNNEPQPPGPPAITHRNTAERPRRRPTWPCIAAIAALGIVSACAWQNAHDQHRAQERKAKAGFVRHFKASERSTSHRWRDLRPDELAWSHNSLRALGSS
ncbi:hypothetical protein ACWDO6_07940 [Streptomyces sp. NPDC003674]